MLDLVALLLKQEELLVKQLALLPKLEEQRRLARDPEYAPVRRRWQRGDNGERTPVEFKHRLKPWWRTDARGTVVLSVKYGFSTIEFEKGKTGIVVGKVEKLDSVIATLIDAVKGGEVDALLETAAKTSTIKTVRK